MSAAPRNEPQGAPSERLVADEFGPAGAVAREVSIQYTIGQTYPGRRFGATHCPIFSGPDPKAEKGGQVLVDVAVQGVQGPYRWRFCGNAWTGSIPAHSRDQAPDRVRAVIEEFGSRCPGSLVGEAKLIP